MIRSTVTSVFVLRGKFHLLVLALGFVSVSFMPWSAVPGQHSQTRLKSVRKRSAGSTVTSVFVRWGKCHLLVLALVSVSVSLIPWSAVSSQHH